MSDLPSNLIELQAQAARTVALRKSGAFRRRLFRARFKQEVLRGSAESRRDFWAFVRAKLGLAAKDAARPLSDFDPTNGEEKLAADALISRCASDLSRRQAVIFSRLQYYTSGCGQRGAQIAKTLGKLGFDVLFLYADDNYYSFDKDFIDGLALHLPVDYLAPDKLVSMLGDNTIAFFEHPDAKFLPYLEALNAKGMTTVYEHIDNWESELGEGWYSRENYERFISEASMLTATARNLCAMVESDSGRSVLYSANAVDIDLFDPEKDYHRPADLPTGSKVLLYYGHLEGNWLDWDLLYSAAALCPDCAFAVIGYGKVSAKRSAPANVHFLGEKQQPELPAYLAWSDFAMLHFNTREVGSYVSPLKVFEYLAMGKRVLAAPLPDIAGYPNVICSADPKVWAENIQNPPKAVPCRDFVAANSWRARCADIIKEADRT